MASDDKSRVSATGTSRLRGTSASKDKDMQFGRGRNTSNTRNQEVSGLNRTRGASANKDPVPKFGQKRTPSQDKMNLGFGKTNTSSTASATSASSTDSVKLDPSMTTIKKTELEALKSEIETQKEEIFNVNIKLKKAENEADMMKRDHKDEIDRITQEL